MLHCMCFRIGIGISNFHLAVSPTPRLTNLYQAAGSAWECHCLLPPGAAGALNIRINYLK